MTRQDQPIIRYSISFKQQVVQELEQQGTSISQIQRKYGITGTATVQAWIRKFGKNHLLNKIVKVQTVEEKDQLKAMQQEIKKLKEALADSYMEKRILETLIDQANKAYKTDLKKNFGDQASANSQESSGS